TLVGHAGICPYIGEGSIAIVVIEDGTSISRNIEIRKAVVIEIAHCNTLAVMTLTGDSRFFRDIRESSIPVIVIKRAANRMRWFVKVRRGGLSEVQVHQTVLIVVDPSHPGSHGLEVVLLFGLSRVLSEADIRALPNVNETYWNCGIRFLRELRGKN